MVNGVIRSWLKNKMVFKRQIKVKELRGSFFCSAAVSALTNSLAEENYELLVDRTIFFLLLFFKFPPYSIVYPDKVNAGR